MRPTLALLALVGCGGGFTQQRAACEQYLDCAAVANPLALDNLEVEYGEDSECWSSAPDADRCAQTCDNGRAVLAAQAPDVESCGEATGVLPTPPDTGTPAPTDTGGGGTLPTEFATDCSDTYTGPILVDEVSVQCVGDDVRYFALTTGWTTDGIVNAMETGNATPWDDEHDINVFRRDECGFDSGMERVLATGAAVGTWSPNQSTVFTCDDHFEVLGVMTYAVRAYDLDGNFADCLAWGHAPDAFINGDYASTCINCPSNAAEIVSCVAARSAL